MKRTLSLLMTCAMLMGLLAGCGRDPNSSSGTAAPGGSASTSAGGSTLTEKREIKEVTTLSSTDPAVQAMVRANDRIREATDGMIDIQMYADGQILTGAEGVEAMRAGAAVFVWNDPSTLSNYVPIYETILSLQLL